jgi:hypothetical protein
LYIGELPYIRRFIEHGLSIGIDEFFFVFPSQEHRAQILSTLAPFGSCCRFIFETAGRNVNKALQVDITKITTDYVISIDVDEFLYLDGGVTIGQWLQERQINACVMPWVMSPRDFRIPSGPLTGFLGHIGKRLARTSLVKGIAGPHAFEADPALRFCRDDHLHLVHYWGRSFEDIVIKCIYQMLPGRKRSSLGEMQALLKTRRLPERLRVLASLTRHKHDIELRHDNHPLCDEELERELLAVASPDFLAELESTYREYRESLDYSGHVATYPGLGNIYDLGRALPSRANAQPSTKLNQDQPAA